MFKSSPLLLILECVSDIEIEKKSFVSENVPGCASGREVGDAADALTITTVSS